MVKFLNYVFAIALGFFAVMFGIDRFGNHDLNNTGNGTLYTAEYCQDITGFNGAIPLEINMVNGKIESIVILENEETPSFLERVTNAQLVENFYGLTPKEAIELNLDAVSGATYSSKAIIKSVKTRMEAYEEEVHPNPWTWQLFGLIGCAVALFILSFFRKK